jgi:hypothetical protein
MEAMEIKIEQALCLARELAARRKSYKVLGDEEVADPEVLAAAHSSFLRFSGDHWIVRFRLEWKTNAFPGTIEVHVDSRTREAKFIPTH